MENVELTALQTVRDEYRKIIEKYKKKAVKEREKVNDVYVMVCGEKCYTESEINDWYANDYITCEQSDKYIEKLKKKKATAGQTDTLTKSERVCRILDNTIANLTLEIRDIKIKEEQEQKKQERWEIAQAQGCSYKEFLELEEVSRQAEEYAEGITAEQVYMDMLVKIVEAPTKIHMRLTTRMLIPIISDKLKERGM